MAAVERLLAVRPELAVDGRRPTHKALTDRLAALWCPDEVILYIGLAGPRTRPRVCALSDRVAEYYATPLGQHSPHAGGWPLKTLTTLNRVRVHYGYCDQVRETENALLDAFAAAASPDTRAALPAGVGLSFANPRDSRGRRQPHGITGARAPRRTPATRAT